MKYGLVAVLVLCIFLAAGCQGTAGSISSPPTPASPVSPSGKPAVNPGMQSSSQSSTPIQGTTESKFFLEVTEPQDDVLMKTSTVRVSGTTSPDADVRVNDQYVVVDQAGNFTVTVSLEVGPNTIEVVASDGSDEEYRLLTVMYLP